MGGKLTYIFSITLILKVDKGKATRSASLCVKDNLYILNGAVLGKNIAEIALFRVH